jgi:hypothetical protein
MLARDCAVGVEDEYTRLCGITRPRPTLASELEAFGNSGVSDGMLLRTIRFE